MAFIRGALGAFVGQFFAASVHARAFVVGVVLGVYVGQNYDVPNVKVESKRLVNLLIEKEKDYRKRK